MLPLARCQSEALPLHSREPFDSLNLTPLSELLSGTMAYWLPVLKGTQRVTSASALQDTECFMLCRVTHAWPERFGRRLQYLAAWPYKFGSCKQVA
jgi:hypothetical protein